MYIFTNTENSMYFVCISRIDRGMNSLNFDIVFLFNALSSSKSSSLPSSSSNTDFVFLFCLYALSDYPIHEEIDTQYDREYWFQKAQWEKLSEPDKVKAADVYNICAPDMLID